MNPGRSPQSFPDSITSSSRSSYELACLSNEHPPPDSVLFALERRRGVLRLGNRSARPSHPKSSPASRLGGRFFAFRFR
jgi:hypothetical protein